MLACFGDGAKMRPTVVFKSSAKSCASSDIAKEFRDDEARAASGYPAEVEVQCRIQESAWFDEDEMRSWCADTLA